MIGHIMTNNDHTKKKKDNINMWSHMANTPISSLRAPFGLWDHETAPNCCCLGESAMFLVDRVLMKVKVYTLVDLFLRIPVCFFLLDAVDDVTLKNKIRIIARTRCNDKI